MTESNYGLVGGVQASSLLAAAGLTFLFTMLLGTMLTWWAIGILRWDRFVADPFGRQARILRFILALVGGSLIGLVGVLFSFAIQFMQSAL